MNYDTSSVQYIIWNPALARMPAGSFFFVCAKKKKKTVVTRATGLARHARVFCTPPIPLSLKNSPRPTGKIIFSGG